MARRRVPEPAAVSGDAEQVISRARRIVEDGGPLTMEDYRAVEAVARFDSFEYLLLTLVHMSEAQASEHTSIRFQCGGCGSAPGSFCAPSCTRRRWRTA